jgi:hypothetical protein
VQIWVVAFLADLLTVARRIQTELRLRARRAELGE